MNFDWRRADSDVKKFPDQFVYPNEQMVATMEVLGKLVLTRSNYDDKSPYWNIINNTKAHPEIWKLHKGFEEIIVWMRNMYIPRPRFFPESTMERLLVKRQMQWLKGHISL